MRKLLALVLVAVMAASPAFAAVQNVKVSGNIASTYLNRDNFDLGANGVDKSQSLFLTQTRLRVDADLSDNVSTSVGLINEREWSAEDNTANDTDIDLYLANVTLREMLYSPLTVVIGRQTFAYGNSLVFDATGTNNAATGRLGAVAADLTQRTALDAIRVILDYKPLTIESFYGKADANNALSTGNIKDDVDVYGLNANYQLGDSMNTVVEAYFFGRNDNTSNTFNPGTGSKNDTVYTPGLRASTNPVKGLNVQGELAWQRGTKVVAGGDNLQRDAMAAQVMTSYELPVLEQYKPVASASYTYLSGDSNGGDTKAPTQASTNNWTGWDPMLENQNGGTIYNSIFNLTNMHIVSAALSANPIEDVTAKLTWSGLWADKSLDRYAGSPTPGNGTVPATSGLFTQPDATGFTPAVNSNLSLGNEFDADFTYAYTEDVKFGLSLGWFIPGSAFRNSFGDDANSDVASQAIASVSVAF